MRGRLLLAVLAAVVVGAGSAHAAPAGWVVTPGGPYVGSGGQVDGPYTCAGSQIAGHLMPVDDVLGTVDELFYQDCQFGLAFAVTMLGEWSLRGTGHVNGSTTIAVEGIAVDFDGPGCSGTVEGEAAAVFHNVTSTLSLVDQHTVVTFVDPANDCLGLISEGDLVDLLSDSYGIRPPQVIEWG